MKADARAKKELRQTSEPRINADDPTKHQGRLANQESRQTTEPRIKADDPSKN